MIAGVVWPALVLMPLLAAVAVLLLRERASPWLWLTCLPPVIAAAWPAQDVEIPFLWPGAAWGAQDSLSRTWLGITALLWGGATAFAAGSLKPSREQERFWLFWLAALAGNLLLIIARDALSFYTGFTVMSLAAYGLVVHFRGPKPRRAGRLYLQMAILGEFLVFAGLVSRASNADASLSLEQWQATPLDGLTLGLLLAGFGIKMGFWPLHVWLPLAHPAAPAPASAVLSGAMLKAGVLGLWRFLPSADPLLAEWAAPVFGLGLVSAFYGILAGLVSTQAKVALAYSSVSQMGYFLIILALAWNQPAHPEDAILLLALFMAHHALAKGALFLAAGVVGDTRLARGGPGAAWWVVLAIPALALAGLPFTSGAAAKGALKTLFVDSDFYGWSLLVTLASTGTTLLLVRAVLLLWQKQKQGGQDANRFMLLPWLLLSLSPLVLPWLWAPMRRPLVHGLTFADTWTLAWPVLLGLVLAGLPLWRGWRLPRSLKVWRNPALHLSLRLKRLAQRPPLPSLELPFSAQRWRQRERRWNHVWQSGSLAISAWLIALLLVIGWLW